MRNRDYLAAVGILLVSVACGQAPQSNVPVNGLSTPQYGQMVSCPGGQIGLGYACLPTTDLAQACAWIAGQTISLDGVLTCRYKMNLDYVGGRGLVMRSPYSNPSGGYYMKYWGYQFLRLNPSMPAGDRAYDTGVYLRKGDKLSYVGDGGWGTSYSRCSTYNARGEESPSHSVAWESMASGVVGSDGVEVFLLGTSLTKSIHNDGLLRIGYNNSPAYTNACGSIKIAKLEVQRCQDATGGVHVCP